MKKPVCIFASFIEIPRTSQPVLVQRWLNVAHGYADGNCNRLNSDGDYVPIDPTDQGVLASAFKLARSQTMPVYVAVEKDGTRRLTNKPSEEFWEELTPGIWTNRRIDRMAKRKTKAKKLPTIG